MVGTASAALAQGAAVQRVTGTYAGEVVIPINKSQIIEVDVAFSRVVVGNPASRSTWPSAGWWSAIRRLPTCCP
jgi:hypothetical protein